MKINKFILALFSILLAICFIIRGLHHETVIARVAYFLVSAGCILGSLLYLYEGVKKPKKR
jgi:hypothetical protein